MEPERSDTRRGHDDIEDNNNDKSRESKHRSKDKSRSSRREDKDHRSRDREKSKISDSSKERDKESVKDLNRDRRKEDGDDREKDRTREKTRDKENDREKDKHRDRERERERGSEKGKDRTREKEREKNKERDDSKILKNETVVEDEQHGGSQSQQSASEIQDRIMRMKEERLKKKSEGGSGSGSDILSWVGKSRKLEEKRLSEKEKALQRSKMFEEQDNVNQGEDEYEPPARKHTSRDLAGFKVLDGLDKVIEGGAVVLTLKDQNILADGDVNQEVDMLENVEIGEQKRRNEAYKAAKKGPGVYDDKFNEEFGAEKKILSKYDDPILNEGITLDERGRFGSEAEKKLDELRRRLDGASSMTTRFEDLTSSTKVTSDYYTTEEMSQFKKPKKKKSIRKKDKLDLDALEAEAKSSGLGTDDRGSRADGKRQAQKQAQEKSESEKRSLALQTAYQKADLATNALRLQQTLPTTSQQNADEDTFLFGDDDDELQKSLHRARKIALQKNSDDVALSGPHAIANSITKTSDIENNEAPDNNNNNNNNKVVFTEMEEFVWGLHMDEEEQENETEDVFMTDDVAMERESGKKKEEEVKEDDDEMGDVDMVMDEKNEREVEPDETIHESALGKGLSGALRLLKDRGTLRDTTEWGGRNMDKKKSKLVGIVNENDDKEIRIERTDEYGRILTPKEAFRLISHKFHGKGPGKMKQEKRMRQYHEELKVKQMRNSDTPSLSVERMREAQSKMKTPYLVLSGHVKPGQTSDPRSGFATMEDFPGSLTPMLGDRKVEHYLGIKRKSEPGDMGPPKKPRA